VTDCPNCGQPVEEGAPLCPHCGFDVQSQQAADVRRLREEGRIHPGRLGAGQRGAHGEADQQPSGGSRTELPAEDGASESPKEIDAGL
jgi:zinc ribbon protein